MEDFNRATELADYPVVIRWPVQWGDQDAFAHVNNTVYFRWFESARIAYMDGLGFPAMLQAQEIGPILAAISANYRRQVTFPDHVQIGARITRLGRTSVTMEHGLYSEAGKAIAADATSTIVVYDYSLRRPHPIPPGLRKAIENIEGKTF
jgi:acyl-CoA thioester hydrolase